LDFLGTIGNRRSVTAVWSYGNDYGTDQSVTVLNAGLIILYNKQSSLNKNKYSMLKLSLNFSNFIFIVKKNADHGSLTLYTKII